MKMNYFTLLGMIVLMPALLTNCSPYRSSSGLIDIKALKSAQITDSGLLYSTYRLTADDREELRQSLTTEVIGLVENQGSEETWPEAISDFKGREAVRSKFSDYKSYLLAEFADKYILIIPARLNKDMPQGMRPEKDIFFIIGKEGVELE